MSGGKLPVTGLSTIMVGGVAINQVNLALIAVGIVIVGAVLYRFGWRRRKPISSR